MNLGDTVVFLAGNNEIHPATVIRIEADDMLDLMVPVSVHGESLVLLQRIDDVKHDAGCATADSWHYVNESLGPSIGVGQPAIAPPSEVALLREKLQSLESMFKLLQLAPAQSTTTAEVMPPADVPPTNPTQGGPIN